MPRKAILNLEWITISYRTIWAVALVILVIVGLAGYQHFFSKPGLSVEALLKSLDFKLEDMGGRVRRNKNLSVMHEDAVEIMKTAWEALARNDFSAAEARAGDASQIVEAIEEELRHIQSRYTARIVSMEGEVKVKPAGDFRWLSAKRGMELKEGDKVSAGVRGSAEIIFRNGDKQLVSPGGLIEIYESRVDPETSAERLSIRITPWWKSGGTKPACASIPRKKKPRCARSKARRAFDKPARERSDKSDRKRRPWCATRAPLPRETCLRPRRFSGRPMDSR
jgi:hypothetical protein